MLSLSLSLSHKALFLISWIQMNNGSWWTPLSINSLSFLLKSHQHWMLLMNSLSWFIISYVISWNLIRNGCLWTPLSLSPLDTLCCIYWNMINNLFLSGVHVTMESLQKDKELVSAIKDLICRSGRSCPPSKGNELQASKPAKEAVKQQPTNAGSTLKAAAVKAWFFFLFLLFYHCKHLSIYSFCSQEECTTLFYSWIKLCSIIYNNCSSKQLLVYILN